MIRITGGKYRSRKLLTPDTPLTKPTMDKVRAAVFNAIGQDIANKKILDLFAGSGSYGFEALSRNAKEVTFVDKQAQAIKAIKSNASILKENATDIVCDDAISFLNACKKKFDIVFVDPPYKLDIYKIVLDLLETNDLLNKNSIIVLESEKSLNIEENINIKIKEYNYGLAKIYILRRN